MSETKQRATTDFAATAFIETATGERTDLELRKESDDIIEVAQDLRDLVPDEATIHCLEVIRLTP